VQSTTLVLCLGLQAASAYRPLGLKPWVLLFTVPVSQALEVPTREGLK